ncbi:hypothetical protein BpHYR1_039392 [Brachionus plicatilis]|uniref:Uncharacterized protein n=1 Tax=Brachionus plicatilis TaxID=10195 RepID=A0A3M7SUC0_BRAPC|nr:hypothetical protein BpHYR1_039392 [Brachionus plicatilis]
MFLLSIISKYLILDSFVHVNIDVKRSPLRRIINKHIKLLIPVLATMVRPCCIAKTCLSNGLTRILLNSNHYSTKLLLLVTMEGCS